MLKTKEVQIEIISRNIKKYISLGYECKVGDFITIKIEDLNKSSDIEIECECDTCHSDIKLVFKSYVRNVARNSWISRSIQPPTDRPAGDVLDNRHPKSRDVRDSCHAAPGRLYGSSRADYRRKRDRQGVSRLGFASDESTLPAAVY